MTAFASDEGPRLLRGGPIAAAIREDVAADVTAFKVEFGYTPALAVVVVGKDAPSAVYLHKILDGCRLVGVEDRLVELPADADEAAIGAALRELQADPHVAGIITQMPLPPGIPLKAVIDVLDPLRDIDGIHPLNAGLLSLGYDGFLPATAHASIEILKQSGIEISGKRAVVVGRSNVIGKPAALLLLRENATVTVCHSKTAEPRGRDPQRRHRRSSPSGVPASSPATCSSRAPSSSTSASTSWTASSWATWTSRPPVASPRPSRRSRVASAR